MRIANLAANRSRPARARGLKRRSRWLQCRTRPVAPRTGAWIETSTRKAYSGMPSGSRPARARGLKQRHSRPVRLARLQSRPARARGLKHFDDQVLTATAASRPARARGLKHQHHCHWRRQQRVAPRTGAWIETACTSTSSAARCVAPRTGAWIETGGTIRSGSTSPRRAPHGRVD